tara:strand:- start:3153 stop:4655 length:1503 start_codon:yes stop_codon:yes gene_type:complete
MNASKVLDYIKQYLVIAICVIVTIAALIGLPMVSAGWNEDVQQSIKSRSNYFSRINKLEKTSFQVPGSIQSQETVINQKLLNAYEQITASMLEDAQRVTRVAMSRNQQSHDVLMPDLFPTPPDGHGAMDVLPRRMHEKLMASYEELLASVNAGSPPPAREVEVSLQAARRQFLEQMMAKDESDELTEEETKQLKQQMTGERLEIYKDRAAEIGVYFGLDAVSPPEFDRARPPSIVDLFSWQWTYWVVEELAGVIRSVNSTTELQNPIKRIDSVRLVGLMQLLHEAGVATGGGGRGGRGGRGGARGGGGGAPGPRSPFGGGAPPGPRSPMGGAPGPRRPGSGSTGGGGGGAAKPALEMATAPMSGATNFDVSVSGRISNQLYDVVVVELDMVVATASIPRVLDAFARQNFMTVLDLKLQPEDAFKAVKDGYYYGSENVSRVQLVVETIWLRSWTRQYMPDEVRAMLGVPLDPPPAPAGGAPSGNGAPQRPGGPRGPGGRRP